mgnify:CR=1 FL=1
MSIRTVLFGGIIALLLLMALSQMALVYGFNQRLEQEISKQSEQLTRVVLQMTAEKLQPAGVSPEGGQQKTEQVKKVQREIKVIELEGDQQVIQHNLQTELQHQLHLITSDDAPPQLKTWHVKSQKGVSPVVADFMRYTLLLIALSTLMAIGLALWLAHRFMRPLDQLVLGFRQLQQGALGHSIKEQGLREYRYVAQQFNTMSRQLADLAAQAEQARQQQHLIELGEISRGMVHALRNPIHTLTLLLEQVAASDDAGLRTKLAETAEQKMQQINRSLTALLTLSCDDINRSQQLSLRSVISDLMLEFSAAEVRFELRGDDELFLAGAESELRAIVHAVLSNAVEASPPQGLIRLTLDATQRQLTIADQGPGLAPGIAERLFSPHCSTKAEGAGMGLYIARRLLERHYQGSINLQNLPAGGCLACIGFYQEAQP